MSAPLLHVSGLSVTFATGKGLRRKKLHAVKDLTLTVERGEIVAVVGESGSGKSTFAKMLLRLLQPTAGAIYLDGDNVLKRERRASKAYRKRVQMVFQDPFGSLNPVHTVGHHIARPLAIHNIVPKSERRARVLELLDQVGLRPAEAYIDQLPQELSGGQRQRVAIARALAPNPDLLVADEPTSMLDVSIRMDVLRLLEHLRDAHGVAIVLITHDLAAARYLADRVAVLYAGQLMEVAPADELAKKPRHPYTRLLVAAAPKPGGSLKAELPARPGLPPNVDPPPGCPFAERCLDVHNACATPLPEHVLAPGHRVRCHALSAPTSRESHR
ncbi:MAG: peptide/nickel transport system ATP-binding protein [Myxococcota bacterium]|jgi:peptide/nickel transport system ATP-binding protein